MPAIGNEPEVQQVLRRTLVTAGPYGYSVAGSELTILGYGLSLYDEYAVHPAGHACTNVTDGVSVFINGSVTDAVVITLGPGNHTVCYRHQPTNFSGGNWTLLAESVVVVGVCTCTLVCLWGSSFPAIVRHLPVFFFGGGVTNAE